jgi:hypothetical protein
LKSQKERGRPAQILWGSFLTRQLPHTVGENGHVYESTNLIIKELNVNYTHGRIRQVEIIVYKIFFSPKTENNQA